MEIIFFQDVESQDFWIMLTLKGEGRQLDRDLRGSNQTTREDVLLQLQEHLIPGHKNDLLHTYFVSKLDTFTE